MFLIVRRSAPTFVAFIARHVPLQRGSSAHFVASRRLVLPKIVYYAESTRSVQFAHRCHWNARSAENTSYVRTRSPHPRRPRSPQILWRNAGATRREPERCAKGDCVPAG